MTHSLFLFWCLGSERETQNLRRKCCSKKEVATEWFILHFP